MAVAISVPLVTFDRVTGSKCYQLDDAMMPVLSLVRYVRDSLFPRPQDPDLYLPFQMLHHTCRNLSYAFHPSSTQLSPMLRIADILNKSTEKCASPSPQSFDNGGTAQGAVAQIYQLPYLLRPPSQDLNPVPLTERDAQRNSSQQLPSLQAAEPSVPLHSASPSVTPVAESTSYPRSQSLTPSLHARSTAEAFVYSYANSAEAKPLDARHGPASGLVAYPTSQEDSSATATSPSSTPGQKLTVLPPSATASEQRDYIKQQHFPCNVVDLRIESKHKGYLREKNRAATKRYRDRKKQNVEFLLQDRDRHRAPEKPGRCIN